MGDTKIEWCDRVWNVCTGCSPVGAGCMNCYARRMAQRLRGRYGYPADDPFRVTLHPEKLDEPLHWRKPCAAFISMGDPFHKDVPFEFIDRMMAVVASTAQHTHIWLTKRPVRMLEYMADVARRAPEAARAYEARMRDHFQTYKMQFLEGYSLPEPPTPELRAIYDAAAKAECRQVTPDGTTLACGFTGGEYHWRPWPLPNLWLGVSPWDQASADEFIPYLIETPAAVKVVSAEPLLGPIKFGSVPGFNRIGLNLRNWWVIVGAETGPGKRMMDIDWARKVRDDCVAAGVPFFLKRDSHGSCLLDSREWNEAPHA